MKRWWIKFFLLFLLALFLLLYGRIIVEAKRPQSLAQDPNIQVYFNQNQARGAEIGRAHV